MPANAACHLEAIQSSFERGTQLFGLDSNRTYSIAGVFPHMHYIGVDVKVTLERADGTDECLLQVPAWNFDWQDRYFYDVIEAELPTIGPDDRVSVQCEYDNTIANPFVRRALAEAGQSDPVDVLLGDGTLDEMCWGGVYVVD